MAASLAAPDQDGCARRLLPRLHGLPRNSGGSASATSLSRPARASLTLRPVGLLNRPRRPLSRGFGPVGCPSEPLVSYQRNRQLAGWNLPPLVNRAVWAHVESRTGAVAWAMRQRSVSRPRSSNRTCGFPASGFPTGFTAQHTAARRVRCVLPKQWAMADAPSSTDRRPSSPQGKASSEASGCSGVFQAHRQSPILGSVQSAPEARALSSAGVTRPPRSYGSLRLPPDPPPVRRGGCQPQSRRVSPADPHHPSTVPCPVPRRTRRVRLSVACPSARPSPFLRRVGVRDFTFEMLWGGRWRDGTIVAGSNADGASHGTAARRFESVPHSPGARQHDHCGHRDEPSELARRRHCSRDRAPSAEEARTKRGRVAPLADALACGGNPEGPY